MGWPCEVIKEMKNQFLKNLQKIIYENHRWNNGEDNACQWWWFSFDRDGIYIYIYIYICIFDCQKKMEVRLHKLILFPTLF